MDGFVSKKVYVKLLENLRLRPTICIKTWRTQYLKFAIHAVTMHAVTNRF